jgi:hypothetical protein
MMMRDLIILNPVEYDEYIAESKGTKTPKTSKRGRRELSTTDETKTPKGFRLNRRPNLRQ